MSFISRSDVIFRRLTARLQLNILKREKVYIPSTIQPVTDINDLLDVLQPISTLVDTDVYQANHEFQVPPGKHWTIIAYYTSRVEADILEVKLKDYGGAGFNLDAFTSGTLHTYYYSPYLELDEGWMIRFVHAANAVQGAITSRIMYREVDHF